MIKNKIKNLDLSATLKINEISKNLENDGKKVIRFGFGQSPFQVPDQVVEELKKMLTKKVIYLHKVYMNFEKLLQNTSQKRKIIILLQIK